MSIFFFILSLNFVSADWGYNSLKTGIRTSNVNQTILNNAYYINGSNINASSITCSGTDKFSAYNNFTGVFTCTTDETSAGGGEPLWSANYTLFNSTWSSIFNQTYNDAWKYVTNNSFYPYTSNPFGYLNTSAEPLWSANFSLYNSSWSSIVNTSYYLTTNPYGFYNLTNFNIANYLNSTHTLGNITSANTSLYNWVVAQSYTTGGINWGHAVNGTLMLASNWNATNTSYYLATNPFSFYNITSWNNPFSYYNSTSWNNPFTYFNLTNFPNYANIYLNTTNQFSFYNLTSFNNPYTYFNLTNFPNYANVYLNTTNQFSYFNLTSFPNYAKVYLNTTNQYSYYNLTTLNNPYAYFNLTNFPNYKNVYLNTTNQFSYYNSTTLNNPYAYWNSTFATFNKTYADTLYYLSTTNAKGYYNVTTLSAYSNTTNQFGYINITTLSGNETDPKAYNTTLAYNVSLGGYRERTNNTFSGNVNISGNNITNVNFTTFCRGLNCWRMYVNESDWFIIEAI